MLRFWVSIITFVVGLSLTAVGIVDQVRNRPLESISIQHKTDPVSNYLLITNRTLTSYPGVLSVTASGNDNVLIATARESDAIAWLGDSPHAELRLFIDAEANSASLLQLNNPGEGALINPAGQDIWRDVEVFQGSGSIEVPEGNEIALVIASDGENPAPGSVSLFWELPDQPLPFSPLPPIGLVLMLLGSAGAIWDAWDKRRKAGVTRGHIGPKGPRSRFMPPVFGQSKKKGRRALSRIAAISLIPAILSGCTAEYISPVTNPSPSLAPDTLTPVMTSTQAERILKRVVRAVDESDAELDRETVEIRVAGAALGMRRAAYNLARRTEAEDGPAKLQTGPIKLFLPSATDTWPRDVMLVTGEETLQFVVLRQEGPRDDYRLTYYMDLLPGNEFPEVANELVGATTVKPDSKFLSFDPTKLPEAVGDLINNGVDSSWASLVDPDNKYVSDLVGFQRNLVETLDNANLTFGHALGNDELALLATADGGALVALYMVDTYTIIPREPGDAIAISGEEALLLGTGGSATGIETRYGAMLLFHVPATGSDQPVRLLGATQQLLSVVNLGAR